MEAIYYTSNSIRTGYFFEGFNIDGSLICDWKDIVDSDLTVIPDPATARIDTIMDPITAILLCDVYDPREKNLFT